MHFHNLTMMMMLLGGNGRRHKGGEEEPRVRNVPVCHTSNGALLKLHHIAGQGSGLVRENVFHLYRQERKIAVCYIIFYEEEVDEALYEALYHLPGLILH